MFEIISEDFNSKKQLSRKSGIKRAQQYLQSEIAIM